MENAGGRSNKNCDAFSYAKVGKTSIVWLQEIIIDKCL